MKTTNRASRKAGKKSTSAQSGKSTNHTSGKTQSDSVTIGLFSKEKGRTVERFEIPRELFTVLRTASVEENESLRAFIMNAVREKIRSVENQTTPSMQSEQIESGESAKVKVSIVSEIAGTRLELFPLPDAITTAMIQRVNTEGYRDIGTAIAQALGRDVVAMKRGHFPSAEFETVIGRTVALLHLVESKLQNDLVDKVNSRGPEYDPVEARRAWGYLDMFNHAQKDLQSIFDGVFEWLQAKDAAPVTQKEVAQ